MTVSQFTAMIIFAFVSAFTPGPNNTIAMVTGVHHGWRAALPHVFGVQVGFSSMLMLGLAGMAAVLAASTSAVSVIRLAGIAYLLWLAWGLFRANSMSEGSVPKPMTFLQSCAFQYANPKGWMIVVATTSTYATPGSLLQQIAAVCTPFFAIGFASTWSWAWAGSALTAWLKVDTRLVWFNRIMALSLAATALWMALS